MVLTKPVFCAVAGLVVLTTAAPLNKRIAQVISDSTTQWVQACTAAGGADKCGTTSQTAFMTLLAGAGDCDQQNAADDMIDLAKTLSNDSKMISLAQVFAQQPRNSPNKLSVNYCQQQPKNAELKGLFQCQFQGVDPKTFTNSKVGGAGTIPLGLNAPLDPPGSCKANPQGGIADGSQLVALTQDPGVENNTGAGSANSTSGASNVGDSSNSTNSSDGGDSADSGSSSDTGSDTTADTDSGSDSGNSPDTGSPDTSGSDAGSNDAAVTATTTVTVTSGADATGVASAPASTDSADAGSPDSSGGDAPSGDDSGSDSGDNSGSNSGDDSGSTDGTDASATDSVASASASADSAAATGGFQLQNGKDAQTLNAKFASLTDSSSCDEGDQACVDNGFAQCVGGKFVTTQCAAGTQCFALPLVNKAGTSIACTTQSDATSRIQATGASGGLTGA